MKKNKKKEVRIAESTHLNDNDKDEDDVVSVSEEQVEKLEEEVKELIKRVEASRSSLPNHLTSSLSSLLSLQRSFLSLNHSSSSSGPHTDPGSISGNSSADVETNDGDQIPDEVKLLRDKISSNIDAIPRVLKRMNECISRVDKLVSSNETIHPVFKRKKS